VGDVAMKKILAALTVCLMGIAAGSVDAGGLSERTSAANRIENLTGFEQTRKCAEEKKRLAVAFLVDESSSIKKADPENLRVRAVTRAISRLSQSLAAVSADDQPVIDVLVAVFGEEFTILGSGSNQNAENWFSLRERINEVEERVQELSERNTSSITDYQTGLEGVEDQFIRYTKKNGAACFVLVWLSDGKIDLDNKSSTDGAEADSYSDMCAKSGVANRLRGMKIFVFGIGLGGTAKQGDFDRMKRLVEGRDDCGSLGGSGGDSTVGLFIPVASADLLEEAFDDIFPPPPPPPVPCEGPGPDPLCNEYRISVQSPTKTARLLLSAPGQITTVRIIRPDSSEVTLRDETGFLPSAATDITVQDLGVSARIEVNVSSQLGQWALQVIGTDSKNALVSLYSIAKPSVSGLPIRLTREKPIPIQVTVKDTDLEGISIVKKSETPSAPTVDYNLTASASFGSSSVPVSITESAGGGFVVALAGSLESIPAQGSLFLTASALVGSTEIPLGDLRVPIALNFGDSFPSVKSIAATPIDAGDRDAKFSTITVTVVGPKDGEGRVRVKSEVGVIQSPPARGDEAPVLIFADGSEVVVAAGQERTLLIQLDPKGEANGELEFGIALEYQSRDGQVRSDSANLRILMEKPFEVVDFLLLLLIMIAVYVLIQATVVLPACHRVARIRGLPVSTRVVSGDILINNVDQIKGVDKKFDEVVSDHRNLGSATVPSLSQTIRGFTLRGFPSVIYRGLFRPRRVPVFIKRSTDSSTELTVGQGGYERLKETTWGLVSPSLNGVWAVSFQESDVRLVQANPNRDLKGHLLYILPEGAGADSAALAQKLLAELETKRFRTLMPKLFDGLAGERSPSDRGGKSSVNDGGGEETKPSRRSTGGDSGSGSTNTTENKKRDLYS
jgi:hypothetical protein